MKKKLIAQAIALIGVVGINTVASAADEPLQRVIVTGSNIKRTAAEGSNSVMTLSRKDIAQTGAVSVPDLLAKIPSLGSGNQVDARDGGFSKGLATASMRGLGSASTLILLNGRRITPSAYADPNAGQSTQYDLNSIPLSAIERVEVLKDGASAVYGSDAIAGVINFITKTNFRGGEVNATASTTERGTFGRNNVNGVYGFGDLDKDGYNAFIAVDLTQRERASLADAHGVRRSEYEAITGRLSNYYSGISAHPVFYKEKKLGSGSYNAYVSADLSCPAEDIRTGSTALTPMQASDPLIGNKFCNYDGWAREDAQGKGDAQSVMARAEFKLGENISAFAEASYARNFVQYNGVSRTITGRSLSTVFPKEGAGTSFRPILGVNHPDNPTRGTANPVPVAVAVRFPAAGGSENTNEYKRVLAGLKGSHFGWDWDAGLLYNESTREQFSYGFVHKPTVERLYTENVPLATILADPNATRNISLNGKSKIAQFDFKGATEFGQLAGGAIGLATGVEFKRESMTLVPDQLTVNGLIVGLANTYAEASRNVGSAFVEVRTPWTKSFEMDYAARLDKYEGFDRSITPKVGAKWTVSPALALRGTYSRGFRAPALTQMVNGGTQYFQNNYEDKLRCNKPNSESFDCLKSLSGVASANPELEPEKAKSFTLGLVASPAANIDVVLDYYRIKKEKEVDLLSISGTIQDPKYASRVHRDPNPGTWVLDANGNPVPNSGPLISVETPYINAGNTDTSGIDLEVVLRNNLGENGRLTTRLNTTYMLTYKKAANPGDPMYDLVGTNGSVAYDLTSVGELPRWKTTLATTWARGAHTLTGTVNFVSGFSHLARYSVIDDEGTVGAYDEPYCQWGRPGLQPLYATYYPKCLVQSFTTVDVAYNYQYSANLGFGVNILNLFDQKAPYDPNYGTAGFNTTLHSAVGRYFSFKASYKF
ncbi:MAG: TonB-dependent receptor [Gammaproteobacteria bacterium]